MTNTNKRTYNGPYEGEFLEHITFPMGGIGAGMICLEGGGALTNISLRHKPEINNERPIFAAICVKNAGAGGENIARVLEGPVPKWKIFSRADSGTGHGRHNGLPHFRSAKFETKFPFAQITLDDPKMPLHASVTGWSPFVPTDSGASSLPVAGLEYKLTNPTKQPIEAVFSFHADNLMRLAGRDQSRVDQLKGVSGFALIQNGTSEKPWDEGSFAVATDDPAARVDCAWFRGGWFDALTSIWNLISAGEAPARPPHADKDESDVNRPGGGGSLWVPFTLKPGESRTIRVMMSWYVPQSDLVTDSKLCHCVTCDPKDAPPPPPRHQPWYVSRFESIGDVAKFWHADYAKLRAASETFSRCFYDTTLPPEVVEAIAANLAILKSPTVLRQPDGKVWAWEGCGDKHGCCAGTCTHVWNYAQAMPHLFADLERTLRETEFGPSQNEEGHQAFRSLIPIRVIAHDFHAAADGQLGGILKAYREWRVSGDTQWLKKLWPRIKQSLNYCINTWDPRGRGTPEEPHHNTYDIEFWGADGMHTSFYLGALASAIKMGEAVGADVTKYRELLMKGRALMESELYNGEYFIQNVRWKDLKTDPTQIIGMVGKYSREALELMEKEGPKYQYGSGCLSDGVIGAWMARVCGVDDILETSKVCSHLAAIYKHNVKADLSEHANPQRPGYALGDEGGVLLCSWPQGGKPALPFPYSDEVWTGIEYQVASHLMSEGMVDEGLHIVRLARDRYDGRVRNPFDEYECGHWYARAMSSYAMLQGLTGLRYDAVEKVLYVSPSIKGDFRAFLSTATGFGSAGIKNGKPFVDVKYGKIDVDRIVTKQI